MFSWVEQRARAVHCIACISLHCICKLNKMLLQVNFLLQNRHVPEDKCINQPFAN